LNTTPSSAAQTVVALQAPAVIAASVVLLEADCLQGWHGDVNLLNDVCHNSEECMKVGMRKKFTYQAHWNEDADVLQKSFGLRLANSTVCFSHFPVRGILRQPW